ncbi:Aste57867_12653 [Aphanomyces stellatus]|uniref:Aste57867_12653 protein n=1 Tax=Aphanomyces stellatus TaxID=120398 RepID=A0A485KWS6_9STRA|nr:hypothetical protein As57867_012607 [Aphanomyces stellatus]VFT89503.1 Aste57867_12653 [Aphanomyces stellatus]
MPTNSIPAAGPSLLDTLGPLNKVAPTVDILGKAVTTAAKGTLYHEGRSAWHSLISCMSFAAGVFLLIVYIQGTVAAGASLVGTTGGVDGATNTYFSYKSTNMPAVLMDLKTKPAQVASTLAALNSTVVYVEASPSNSATTYTLSTSFCSTIDPKSKLAQTYDATVLLTFVSAVVAGLGESWHAGLIILVDCAYGGIASGDSSALRLYVVNTQLTWIVSLTSCALNLIRPASRAFTAGTIAYAIHSPLDSIQGNPVDGFSRPVAMSDVATLLAIQYPFQDAPFQPFIFDQVNANASITAILQSPGGMTNESVLLSGFDGSFRDAPGTFGHFYMFTAKLPTDAVRDLYVAEFLGVPTSKNGWAWGHVVVHGYAVAMITYTLACATLVAINTSARLPYLWPTTLPDVSHRVAKAAAAHGVLCLGSCVLDNGWALYEWADISFNRRSGLNFVVPTMANHARAMLFSWVILLCHLVARTLRLNVSLPIVMAFLVIGDASLVRLNSSPWALFEKAAYDFFTSNNHLCLVSSRPNFINLWTYHELPSWDVRFILNEMSCFVWSLVAVFLLFALLKVIALVLKRFDTKKTVRPKWASFASKLNVLQVDSAFVFENRKAYKAAFGLHTAFSKRMLHARQVYASPEWLWELGYVVVGRNYLFLLEDLPKLFLNCILRDELFYVYGYMVEGNLLGRELAHVLLEDLSLRTLCRLSLLPLRQDPPQGTARFHHDLYESVERSKRVA